MYNVVIYFFLDLHLCTWYVFYLCSLIFIYCWRTVVSPYWLHYKSSDTMCIHLPLISFVYYSFISFIRRLWFVISEFRRSWIPISLKSIPRVSPYMLLYRRFIFLFLVHTLFVYFLIIIVGVASAFLRVGLSADPPLFLFNCEPSFCLKFWDYSK